MSAVQIQGNAAGTGTQTIAAPNTNTNQTLTLPDNTGTLLSTASTFAGTGPAFSAYSNNTQTITSGAAPVKININTKTTPGFDTNSNFDTTNYRFQPTVAGYYQINGVAYYSSTVSMSAFYIYIYKNNASYKYGSGFSGTATAAFSTVNDIIYLNGSSDYVELFAYIAGTGTLSCNAGQTFTSFSGALVRGA